MQLSSIVHFYKRMQVNKVMLIKFSDDPTLPKLYDLILRNQQSEESTKPHSRRHDRVDSSIDHPFNQLRISSPNKMFPEQIKAFHIVKS